MSLSEFSTRLKFSNVTKWFEKIHDAKTNNEKAALFQKFISKIEALRIQFKDEEPNGTASSYSVVRLFMPKMDTERDSYGLQKVALGKLLVKALAINPQSADARKLTLQGVSGDTFDYGTIVYNVMIDRSPKIGSLKIQEVNNYLDLIADHFKQNERKKIDAEMVQMLSKMSAIDRKWLARIILKKMNFGLGEKRMLQLLHKDALNYYNQYSHLSNVMKAIESGQTFNEHQKTLIELFKPNRPMLCERGHIKEIVRMLDKHEYYLETKMDGERCHIHMNGKEFKYFSRSCNEDFTLKFGANPSNGLYTPMLHQLLNGKIQNAILDGEMMVWNREEEIFHIKAEHTAARHLNTNDTKLNACFVIYDIIHLNGMCLTNKPYAERQSLLRSTFGELTRRGIFMRCEQTKLRDANHFLECLNRAFDANEEGVVIKQSDSCYRPGQRDKGGWFKIKPDYTNNLVNDFDLLIIGANYNEWRNGFTSFLLGVFDKHDNETDSGVFHAVCSVRNGFSRAQFRDICTQLKPYWNEVQKSRDNRSVKAAKTCIEWNRALPGVWIEPKHSIVVQIKGSELTETGTFSTRHTIRFARVTAIRKDKMWYDVCTLNEFKKCCSSNSKVEKLTKRHATASDITDSDAPLPKRAKKDPVPQFKYSTVDLDDIKAIDESCNALDFCILSSEKKSNHSINDLKAMVLRHGGRIVENPGPKTYVCIAGDETRRVIDMVKSKKYNIASTKWLIRALGSDEPAAKLLPFNPKDMIFQTELLREQFANDYDIYGDSFTEPIETEEELAQLLKTMPTDDLPILTNQELHDAEIEVFGDKCTRNMFRLCTAFFYNGVMELDKDFEMAQFIFKMRAGNSLNTLNDIQTSASRLTHIFVRDANFNRTKLKDTFSSIDAEDWSYIKILRSQWISDCDQRQQQICDNDYRIYLNE